MEVVEFVKPIVFGCCIFFLFAVAGWGIYSLFKKMGISFKPKPKVSIEILKDAAVRIVGEKRSFQQYGEYISKFDLPLQEKYIEAYYQIKKLEGGVKNG